MKAYKGKLPRGRGDQGAGEIVPGAIDGEIDAAAYSLDVATATSDPTAPLEAAERESVKTARLDYE